MAIGDETAKAPDRPTTSNPWAWARSARLTVEPEPPAGVASAPRVIALLGIRRFDLLAALYVTCICISELMGGKTFPLLTVGGFSLSASVAIFVVPLVYCINDAVTEVFGRPRAQSLVRSGLLMIAVLLGFSVLAVNLPATPRFAASEPAYATVFGISARIAFASLVAFGIGEFADVLLFTRLRAALSGRALWLRTNLANILGQLLDTSLFLTLAFYSLDKPVGNNVSFLLGLFVPYWLVKCAVAALETPLVYATVAWLRRGGAAA